MSDRLTTALVALAALALAVLGASGLAGGSRLPAFGVVAILGGLVVMREPKVAITALLAAIAFLPDRFGHASIGGFDTDIVEVLGFSVLATWLVHAAMGLTFRRSAFRFPVALLLLGTAVGAVVARSRGTDIASIIGSAKVFAFYGLIVAVPSLLDDSDRDWLANQVVRLATAGAAVIVGSAAIGRPPPGTRTYLVTTLDVTTQADRLRSPATALILLATLIVLHRLVIHGSTAPRLACFGVLIAAQALSFYRSTYVPMVVAMLVFIWLRPGRRQAFRGFVAGTTVVIIAVLTFVAASNGVLGGTGRALALRVSSIGNSHVLQESSLADRTNEWKDAATALRKSPIVGVGIGSTYGEVQSVYDLDQHRRIYTERLYIHNSWLGAWLRMGLLGVAGFLLLLWRAGTLTAKARRELPTASASLAVAAGITVFAFAIQSSFQTTLTDRATIMTLACALALIELGPSTSVIDDRESRELVDARSR